MTNKSILEVLQKTLLWISWISDTLMVIGAHFHVYSCPSILVHAFMFSQSAPYLILCVSASFSRQRMQLGTSIS